MVWGYYTSSSPATEFEDKMLQNLALNLLTAADESTPVPMAESMLLSAIGQTSKIPAIKFSRAIAGRLSLTLALNIRAKSRAATNASLAAMICDDPQQLDEWARTEKRHSVLQEVYRNPALTPSSLQALHTRFHKEKIFSKDQMRFLSRDLRLEALAPNLGLDIAQILTNSANFAARQLLVPALAPVSRQVLSQLDSDTCLAVMSNLIKHHLAKGNIQRLKKLNLVSETMFSAALKPYLCTASVNKAGLVFIRNRGQSITGLSPVDSPAILEMLKDPSLEALYRGVRAMFYTYFDSVEWTDQLVRAVIKHPEVTNLIPDHLLGAGRSDIRSAQHLTASTTKREVIAWWEAMMSFTLVLSLPFAVVNAATTGSTAFYRVGTAWLWPVTKAIIFNPNFTSEALDTWISGDPHFAPAGFTETMFEEILKGLGPETIETLRNQGYIDFLPDPKMSTKFGQLATTQQIRLVSLNLVPCSARNIESLGPLLLELCAEFSQEIDMLDVVINAWSSGSSLGEALDVARAVSC